MTTKSAIMVHGVVVVFSEMFYTMHHRDVCVIIIIDHFYMLPLLYIAFVFLFLFPEMFTPCVTGTCVLLLSLITFIYYRFYILPLFFFFFFQRCLRHASQGRVCYYYHWSLLYITAFIYCLCFSFSFSRDVYAMHHRNVCVIIIIDHFYILPLFQALKQTRCIYELNALPIWTSALATITVCSDRDLHQGPM